jgi:hypothetical protein
VTPDRSLTARIDRWLAGIRLQARRFAGSAGARREGTSGRGSATAVGIVGALVGALVGATFALVIRGHPFVSAAMGLSMATVFDASFLLVAPVWVLMVLAPTWDVTERVVDSRLIVVPAAALYLLLLVPQAESITSAVTAPSLPGVTALLATDAGATLTWVHFLAFDLFVGRWIYLDARRRGLPSVVVSPLLVLTLLFGPVGFLGYWVVRAVSTDG